MNGLVVGVPGDEYLPGHCVQRVGNAAEKRFELRRNGGIARREQRVSANRDDAARLVVVNRDQFVRDVLREQWREPRRRGRWTNAFRRGGRHAHRLDPRKNGIRGAVQGIAVCQVGA